MIALELTPQGGIKMLQDDAVDLREFGRVEVTRASNVEFDNEKQRWFVQSARTGRILKDDFLTRAAALAWEHEYYSPAGEGWKEVV